MTVSNSTTEQCAVRVMEVIPQVMRALRMAMYQHTAGELTMPQFRAMKIVNRHKGASLSLVADHLGTTLSAASKLIDGLVERHYLSRDTDAEDRRRIILAITPQGEGILATVHQVGVQMLMAKLSNLTEEECRMVETAMALLSGRLAGGQPMDFSTENGGTQCR